MSKLLKRISLLFICLSLSLSVFSTPLSIKADTESSLRNEIAKLQEESKKLEADIARLKNEKKDQSAVLAAVQKKISNTQAQINRCNSEINSINAKISENNAQIDAKNAEIEQSKTTFKKRIRAIYMSNTGSSIQFLLGAESFAEYLQLSQLTSSVSSHDKKMIEGMVSVIKELEKKNEENDKLLAEQVSVKNTIQAAQKQLQAEENEAQAIYNSIYAEQKNAEQDNKEVEAQIKQKTQYLNEILYGGAEHNSFINTVEGFIWPVPSCMNITSYYGERWGTTHYGIDISNGSIYGKPIVAITDGTVYRTYTACPHKTKSSRCRCGSGWGNHVGVNHGTIGGSVYKAMYAHMDTVAVANGQYVKQGQVLGYVGTTGDSTGYHLHFGLMKNDSWVNPMSYFRKVG